MAILDRAPWIWPNFYLVRLNVHPVLAPAKFKIRRQVTSNNGKGSSPSCIDFIVVPLGTVIDKGLRAGTALCKGMSLTRKWPVDPESGSKGSVTPGAGGPDDCNEDKLICRLFLSTGSPPFQDPCLRRRVTMVVEPPIIFASVASFL